MKNKISLNCDIEPMFPYPEFDDEQEISGNEKEEDFYSSAADDHIKLFRINKTYKEHENNQNEKSIDRSGL
jgi:hypothetical protein